ncbi:hypothetical protein CSC16_2207 [Proteus mirabilis]|nr:hypothetical protein CSC16_2207 [Proteus mirabilis]KXC00291.1 hypothetical protein HMPREF3203_02197 [Proteus mirabilis]
MTPNSWTTNYWGSFYVKYRGDLNIIIANQWSADEAFQTLSEQYLLK